VFSGIAGLLCSGALKAQTGCADVQLQLTPDYSFAIGSSTGGSTYAFTLGSTTLAQGPFTQLALFHFDNSLQSTSGVNPAQATGTSFQPGKWGSAVEIAPGGILAYPTQNLSLQNGTIEVWVSPIFDGTNAAFAQPGNEVLQYYAANGDQLYWGANTDGTFSAGTTVGSNNYGVGGSSLTNWKVGDWHHLALTYSVTAGRLRFYVDGTLISEYDGTLAMPAANGSFFTVDSNAFGHAAPFLMDELRTTSDERTQQEISYDATRTTPFADNEVLLPLAGVAPGQLGYQVTGSGAATPCGTATYTYVGIPITNLNPPSNLLASGSTSVSLTFNTILPSSCAYSVGALADYSSMTPFATGQGTTSHQGAVSGLSPSPQVLNQVYLRCDSNPDYVQQLEYRSVATLDPPFPRIGNIWWGSYLYSTKPDLALKTSLFLGPSFTADQINSLRAANPGVLALPSLGSTYTPPPPIVTPAEYLMYDVNGNPIEVWPSTPPTYLLNLTKPEVAEWAANNLSQQLVQSNLAFDGVFLDSVTLNISWLNSDALGNPVQISSADNGVADDPATLDAAWQAGMLLEFDTLRSLAPNAYMSCHCGMEPDVLSRFNGRSLVFTVVDAREGRIPFSSLWDQYNTWSADAKPPIIVNVEDSPPNQVAYGYGQPIHNMPPGVAQFAQTFYPNMRFGLATTLMNNGFFFYDLGDAGTQTNWWYDEYDFSLGYPLGPPTQLGSAGPNLLTNGGFEGGLQDWTLSVAGNNSGPGMANLALDSGTAAPGSSASAHITVLSVALHAYDIQLQQTNLPLTAGVTYQLTFWALADSPRVITVNSQGGPPNWPSYGLYSQISIGTTWQQYSASFTAPVTATDGIVEFWVGDVTGNVWIDGVTLSIPPLAVYRRDFTNGVVLLNGTNSPQTFLLEPGLHRFSGSQAPKYQYIVDDSDAGFTSSGAWQVVQYDSGVLWDDGSPTSTAEANGPYYHAWKLSVHELDVASGTAQWNLNIPEDGQYTIQIWLPAAPNASTWTKDAVYEVVSGGNVVASATVDQTIAASGDGWNMVATVSLTAAGAPFLRVHNGGPGSLIADAVYITSAALYNDGSLAPQVMVAPMDGILLQRENANRLGPHGLPPRAIR
jgi:hypothetical protein